MVMFEVQNIICSTILYCQHLEYMSDAMSEREKGTFFQIETKNLDIRVITQMKSR